MLKPMEVCMSEFQLLIAAMRKVVLSKSWVNRFGRKYPIGQIILCDKDLEWELKMGGYAEGYEGEYPPKKKVKTNLFKPKEKWQ